jgi:hypothetical protein
MRRASAAEFNDMKARAAVVFKDRDDFPDGPIAALKPEKTLYWSAGQGGHLLALVTVRFKGVANSYCRLVTLDSEKAAPVLVDLPDSANSDACRAFHDVRYLDINGDGKLDIVASMNIKSNSFDGYVDQPVVYLSNADKQGGYCYSATASKNLKPEQMVSADKVKQALEQERKRLGVAQFDCAVTGAP